MDFVGGAAMAQKVVVPATSVAAGRRAFPSPSEAGHSVPASVKDPASTVSAACSDRLAVVGAGC